VKTDVRIGVRVKTQEMHPEKSAEDFWGKFTDPALTRVDEENCLVNPRLLDPIGYIPPAEAEANYRRRVFLQ
jgi:hypothetical protein